MMKRYTARTVQDAINLACQDLGVTIDDLNYEVISETVSSIRANKAINKNWKDKIDKDYKKRGARR